MLQVINRTPLAATLSVFPNPAGIECVYGAVKATFDLANGAPRLAPRQAQFLATDVYWGDPAQTSLRAAGDVILLKAATDVILSGRAVAPHEATEVMEVRFSVGAVNRTLRIFGDRHWSRQGKNWTISRPTPITEMPLRWEQAFGGTGKVVAGKPPEHDARNPVGVGFFASYDDDFEGRPLPNIEDPAQLITDPRDRPVPAGVAPVAPMWSPRRTYAGTYDDAWQHTRAPFLPLDFNPQFFNVAAPGLVAPGYLHGGEPVAIVGCTAGGPLCFTLPVLHLALKWDFDGRQIDGETKLDTVLIEPDFARLQMVWRAELAVDKKLTRMRRLEVSWREDAIGQLAMPRKAA